MIDEVTNDFIACLSTFPKSKWRNALLPVTHQGLDGEKKVPVLLVSLGGAKNIEKVKVANKAFIDWMAITKKKSKHTKCQWYQPSTQNQRFRTFLGSCSKRFDWRMEVEDFSFKGGLKGFLSDLYCKRHKEFRDVSKNEYVLISFLYSFN